MPLPAVQPGYDQARVADCAWVLSQVEGRLFSLNARWLRANSPKFQRLRRGSSSPSDLSIALPDVTVPEIEALEEFIENRRVRYGCIGRGFERSR